MNTEHHSIAFVTDDGSTISAHFGRALYYEIISLEGGKIVQRRRVGKDGHHTWGGEHHGSGEHGHDHGPHQDHKHAAMTAPLSGVSVLVARGMGMGAQQHLLGSGIRPILTDVQTIDAAVEQYIAGTLTDNPRRLHDHGPHHHD